MEIIGYLASVLVGVSLGLIGGGGSVLTVPVLVYLFDLDAVTATGHSLFIVGLTSAVGAIHYYRKGLVNVKTAVIFGIPSIIAVYATRAFIVPAIPDEIFSQGGFLISKGLLLMTLFALLMIIASCSMITSSKETAEETAEQKFNYPLILVEGGFVGVLTGLVGAGGGFLIIPALVVLSKLPMKMAVGTSLAIIAAKSLIGFSGELGHQEINWVLLGLVSAFAVVGIFIGMALSKRIEGEKLKPAFGWFVLITGITILVNELFL